MDNNSPVISQAAGPDGKSSYDYVGATACKNCHGKEFQAWTGSHHQLAMQEAGPTTVLGNFEEATFKYQEIESRFFKRDGKYMVRTDDPDGKLADFGVKYTFGVTPLQQYLVQFPGGRLQALPIAWDTRSLEQGGQRWFHLYPNERITHKDELHWTGLRQNWNYMCAECHSTNLQKNYDSVRREYKTTWSEINVSCEACHGPGSRHVVWAKQQEGWQSVDGRTMGLALQLNERNGVQWLPDAQSGNARRSAPRKSGTEIQLCARCHSRRAQLFDDYRHGGSLMDTHLPSLLIEGLYHADGQIDGEVYEYGSFVQSKMYKAGVTCSDCHEPHSGTLRAQGNVLCATCHMPTKYDTATHHRHKSGSAGATCVACHMAAKTYMVVDPRRDHSFRIPRPDLTARIGTPNACNGCHKEKPAAWAASKVHEWYGPELKGYQGYAERLHAARAGTADAESSLTALSRNQSQPAVARATAVMALGNRLNQQSVNAVIDALKDRNPMVRAGALEALPGVPLEQRWQMAHGLLSDPVRAVRIRAAGLLAPMRSEGLSPAEQADFERAMKEYLAAQRRNADDPATQVNVGNFYLARGDSKKAEEAYREALNLDPHWLPAYVNLADLLRQTNNDAEGKKLLDAGLARQPKAAALHHSLGLLQVRAKNLQAALSSLKRAAELAPGETRYSYVYAVALHDTGKTREALSQIDAALMRIPGDPRLSELRSQLARVMTAR